MGYLQPKTMETKKMMKTTTLIWLCKIQSSYQSCCLPHFLFFHSFRLQVSPFFLYFYFFLLLFFLPLFFLLQFSLFLLLFSFLLFSFFLLLFSLFLLLFYFHISPFFH